MILTLITPMVTAWVLFSNVVTEFTLRASVWATINLPMLFPSQPMLIPMKACWPENNTLTSSQLGSFTNLLGGALGGILNDIVNIAVLVGVVVTAGAMWTKKGPEFLRKLPGPAVAALYGLLILIAYYALKGLLYNRC